MGGWRPLGPDHGGGTGAVEFKASDVAPSNLDEELESSGDAFSSWDEIACRKPGGKEGYGNEAMGVLRASAAEP